MEDEVLKQIEREVRMREGASKLLAACSRSEQALEASKSLLTCTARILALLSQLQRMRNAQVLQRVGRRPSEDVEPCLGKISLSDLRIPLMWKDSEYFKNKGELQRCAVFCLLQCGTEIHDTDLVMVDRTLTDICFEGTTILGPKYNLLAHTTLRIEHVREGFKTHDWCLAATEDNPFWLPLYGNMCCRLVAQPRCMMHPIISGRLEVKLGDDLHGRERVYGVLRGQSLLCYQNQEDHESEDKPLLVVPIKKDTVCMSENDPVRCQSISISTQCQGEAITYSLSTQELDETQRWSDAIGQHVYNMSQWKQCCDQLMKIETQSSRKVIPVKQGSLYHEIVTPSSPGEGLVVPDLSVEIRTLLSSYYKESEMMNMSK
ncbi:Rhotekin [Liparis tanakae]|uniref:Rhotekin n=1 Tax=Liparis tanakae TaxID=230148 RepID=A0A4Z2GDE5_9TELE|nr:Rhotekin [Liparis tanakae]